MALGFSGTALPATGVGNIGLSFGSPNTPGVAAPASPNPFAGMVPPVGGPITAREQPTLQNTATQAPRPVQSIGNINPGATPGPLPGAQQPQSAMGFGRMMSQLPPQAMQALRGIPRDALQHLHNAGLIHPGLMQHFYGQQQA